MNSTHREAEPQRLMSSGETEEEQQSLTCVCILHPNERNVNRKPWRHTDQRSSFLTQSAYFPLSDHDSQKKLQESVFAFPDPVFPESLKTQKGNILSTKDISSVIPNNLNVSNRHNKNTVSGCIILCDGWELFHPIRNWGKFPGHCWTMDNMFMLKPSIIQKSLSPITEDDANGNVINLQSHLQMCRNSNDPGESAGQDGNGKRKKSVSFDEDVTVYLFDQVSLSFCSLKSLTGISHFFNFFWRKRIKHKKYNRGNFKKNLVCVYTSQVLDYPCITVCFYFLGDSNRGASLWVRPVPAIQLLSSRGRLW